MERQKPPEIENNGEESIRQELSPMQRFQNIARRLMSVTKNDLADLQKKPDIPPKE
jgi:hypothetical protein